MARTAATGDCAGRASTTYLAARGGRYLAHFSDALDAAALARQLRPFCDANTL